MVSASAGGERNLDLANVRRANSVDRGVRRPFDDQVGKEAPVGSGQDFIGEADVLDQLLTGRRNLNRRQALAKPAGELG